MSESDGGPTRITTWKRGKRLLILFGMLFVALMIRVVVGLVPSVPATASPSRALYPLDRQRHLQTSPKHSRPWPAFRRKKARRLVVSFPSATSSITVVAEWTRGTDCALSRLGFSLTPPLCKNERNRF
jgi:hypothetical protein